MSKRVNGYVVKTGRNTYVNWEGSTGPWHSAEVFLDHEDAQEVAGYNNATVEAIIWCEV